MGIFKKTTILNSAARFILLQLFISCISLPLLGHWGLPQPLLSPLGNILFAPLLTGFLFLSTLIFFAYIFALPMDCLLYCLEKITDVWTSLLKIHIDTPFASCVQPPLFILITLPLAALFVVTHQKISNPYKAIGFLALLLLITHAILYFFYTSHAFVYSLSYNNGTVTIIRSQKQTIVIDPGVIGKRISATSWCEYTLIPEIIKKTGNSSIDHFVCLKPGKVLFDALEKIAQKTKMYNLYIPWWTNHVPLSCWRSYCFLKKTVLGNKGKIHLIGSKKSTIGSVGLSINATQENRVYHDAQFPRLYIDGIIDNNCISIYAP